MEVFSQLDESLAIIRVGKGIEKQVKLFLRGTALYVPYGGGYVEVRKKLDGLGWATAHPLVRLLEFEGIKTVNEAWLGYEILRYKA
jgi:hypothetical protein